MDVCFLSARKRLKEWKRRARKASARPYGGVHDAVRGPTAVVGRHGSEFVGARDGARVQLLSPRARRDAGGTGRAAPAGNRRPLRAPGRGGPA